MSKKLVWHTEKRKVKDLVRYEKNPRKLSPQQLEGLKRSLKKFDLAELPCINTDGMLVAGNQRVLSYCLADPKRINKASGDEMQKGITNEESINFATARTYLEYHHTLHIFTFFNLPFEVRKDLSILDNSVGFNGRYLENEVLLYEMLKDGKLSKKDKETLIEMIFSRLYYEGIRKMRGGAEKDGFMIGESFADLPFKEIMHKVADDVGIKWNEGDEEKLLGDIETYAKEKDTTMEHLTKETLNAWLDNGLFTTDFTPIFASDQHNTWDGNTTKSHNKLFAIWYEELEKSKKYFSGLFSARKLKRQEFEMTMLGETRVVEMITGESLYICREDLDFVHEYKKQVDMILPFSNFVLFIEKYAKPVRNYVTLRQFKKLGSEIADIFDADFVEQYDSLIESYQDEVKLINYDLARLTDMATEHLYKNAAEDIRYEIHIHDGRFWIDLEEESEVAEIVEKYEEEFKKLGA